MPQTESQVRDEAKKLAEKIVPLLKKEDDFTIKLKGSTVWLEDIHSSGFVAWAPDDTGEPYLDTDKVYPEVQQIFSGVDFLPTVPRLERFIKACKHLAES